MAPFLSSRGGPTRDLQLRTQAGKWAQKQEKSLVMKSSQEFDGTGRKLVAKERWRNRLCDDRENGVENHSPARIFYAHDRFKAG